MKNRLPGTGAYGISYSYRAGRGLTIYRDCSKGQKIKARQVRKR